MERARYLAISPGGNTMFLSAHGFMLAWSRGRKKLAFVSGRYDQRLENAIIELLKDVE